jgi:signal transduction histidine kinase
VHTRAPEPENVSGQKPLPRTSRIPLAFVLLALLALAAVPLLESRYIHTYRVELRRVDPARDLVTTLQTEQALGGAALRDLLNTNDPQFLRRYQEALTRERSALAELAPIARELGGDVLVKFNALQGAEELWDQRASQLLRAEPRDVNVIEQTLADEDVYERTLIAAAELDITIGDAGAALRRRVDRAEQTALAITLALVTLAAAAGLVVARLGRQLRIFALAAEERRLELERVMDSKDRLTRGITHDLKNPLGVILGHVDLLEEGVYGKLNGEQSASLGRIRNATSFMMRMIDTLLELARAEAGQIRIERTPTDLQALVEDVGASHRAAVESAGLTFDITLMDGAGPVPTDPARVVEVLDNLLSNAIKYTKQGRVRLSMTRNENGAPKPGDWIAIAVEDSGPGIPKDQQEQIFEEFSRLRTDSAPGAGLGLAISRRIARLLGGDITVDSDEGKGTRFTFWLPG